MQYRTNSMAEGTFYKMKRASKKHIIRLLAFILSFVMLFTTALPVFSVTVTTDKEQLTGADIVSEDVSKREKFSKHFLTGDGTYFAVAYAEQVNYLDDDGEWKEVDNTSRPISLPERKAQETTNSK